MLLPWRVGQDRVKNHGCSKSRVLVTALLFFFSMYAAHFGAYAVCHMARACTDQFRRNRRPDAYHPDQIGFVV